MSRKLFIFLLCFVLVVSVIPLVSAVEELIMDTGEGDTAGVGVKVLHPSGVSDASAQDSHWYVNNEAYITKVEFRLCKYNAPNVLLRGFIANSTHDIVEYSVNTINSTLLTSYSTFTAYNFTYSGDYLAIDENNIYVGLLVEDVILLDTNNYVIINRWGITENVDNGYKFVSGGWFAGCGVDVRVFGNDTPASTPSPSPSPVPSSSIVGSSSNSIPTVYLLFLLIGAIIAVMLGLFKVFEGEDNRPLKLLLVLVGLVLFIIVFMWLVVALGI